MFKVAPISSGFMLFSMFGFIISAFFINHPIFKSWAWAFMIVFVIMFIASLISMTKAPIGEEEYLDSLAIHKKGHYKKK
ncbi:MAG: hypothetical protein ISS25_00570 [Nanoarchaeota archaeon]|nr:hypothetical protein [DPANN group archaeon]MBL7116310.1 hypothetical protein [Nanoarchaeota archaeon]